MTDSDSSGDKSPRISLADIRQPRDRGGRGMEYTLFTLLGAGLGAGGTYALKDIEAALRNTPEIRAKAIERVDNFRAENPNATTEDMIAAYERAIEFGIAEHKQNKEGSSLMKWGWPR